MLCERVDLYYTDFLFFINLTFRKSDLIVPLFFVLLSFPVKRK